MREISFRGMDINGKWHYGLLAESAGFPKQPDAGVYISNFAGYPWAFRVRIETVGQYTGLKDKNGKEIYEGDIVEYEGLKYLISVDEVNTGWYLARDRYINDVQSEEHLIMSCGNESEVIGNIYESPELLQQPTG